MPIRGNVHGSFTGPGPELYELTKALCWGGLRVDRGTPYPCFQSDLDSYRNPPPRDRYTRYMSQRKAVSWLLDFLDPHRPPSREVRSAIRRLRWAATTDNKAPDVAIKAFRDLDTVFFGGVLSNRCTVRVSPQNESWFHVSILRKTITLYISSSYSHILVR